MERSGERSDELRILLVATVETLHDDSNTARCARRSSQVLLEGMEIKEEEVGRWVRSLSDGDFQR